MKLPVTAIVGVLCLFCSSARAQSETKVSGTYTDASITEILTDLGNRYNISFAFDSYALSKNSRSWSFESVEIEKVLHDLLDPAQLTFLLEDNTYIIYWTDGPVEVVSRQKELEGFLTGEVRDADSGELLPYAVLSFRHRELTTTTNADGLFHAVGFDFIKDTVDLFFVGYEPKSVPLSTLGHPDFVVFEMTPARNYLPDVLIRADQSGGFSTAENSTVYNINPGEMATSSGVGERDLLRLVQMIPGISATQETNNGLYVRGSNSDQTMISLDGFTIYHQDHLFGTFTAVNANAVKSMHLHKGIMEITKGGRTAGVLEMVGREGNLRRKSARIDIGTLAFGASVEAPIDTAGKSSVIICGRRSLTDVVFTPAYKSLFNTVFNTAVVNDSKSVSVFEQQNGPDYFFQDANVKFTHRPSAGDAVNISLYASKDQLAVQYADTADSEATNIRDVLYADESVKKNVGGSLRWTRRISPAWESLFSIGISRFDGSFFSADTIKEILFQTDSVNFSFESNVLDDFSGLAGFNAHFRLHDVQIGTQVNTISINRKLNIQGVVVEQPKQLSKVYTVFCGDEMSLGTRWKLSPGLRLNWYNNERKFYPEPRINITYEPRYKFLRYHLAAGRSAQFVQRVQTQNLYLNTPDYWQIASTGNQQVLITDQVLAGLKWTNKGWTIDVEFYMKWNDGNSIMPGVYARFDDGRNATNQILNGSGEAKGADILILKDIKRHHFVLGYSWLESGSHYDDLEQEVVMEAFALLHEAKIQYELVLKRWRIGAVWVYGSGRPYTPLLGTWQVSLPNGGATTLPLFGDFNSGRLPAYHRADISAVYAFGLGRASAEIQFSVYNIYNRKNIRDIQYLTLRNGLGQNDYSTSSRPLQMIGFLPTVNFSVQF